MLTQIEGFRLSPQQRRVWKLRGAAGGACVVRCAVAVEGALSREALAAALARVVARHEILRTAYHRQPGIDVPLQVIDARGAAPSLTFEDATGLDPRERAALVSSRYEQLAAATFDYARPTQLAAHLVAESPEKHVLLLSLPALAADARTLGNLVRELAAAYKPGAQEDAGEDAADVEEPTQYVQFSEWQNELLEEEGAAGGAEFWRAQALAPVPEPMLPNEARSASRAAGLPNASHRLEFASETRDRFAEFAARRGVALEAALLACWQTLLWRLSGQTFVLVGVECDGRKYDELQDALGLFAKTVPVAHDFARAVSEVSFAALASETEEALRDASAWQEYFTYEKTFGEGDAGEQSFLPVGFCFAERPARAEAHGVGFQVERQSSCADLHKLKLCCLLTPRALEAEFQYDPARLSPETVALVARCFARIVESAVENPDTAVAELDVAQEADWSRLSDTRGVEAGADACVHKLFEEQAARTPDAPAVRCGDAELTYSELNARANRVAHHLRALGVGADVPVGLCLERSAEMIVALLGVLKAGGAYLPLDPEHPETRLSYQLAQSRARVLVTRAALRGRFADFAGEVVCLDRDAALVGARPSHNPEATVAPDNLVYVIYTSGSTGTPKGVAVEHRNLSNYTAFVCGLTGARDAAQHFATVSTVSADLGNTCLFPSLVSGGCLHVIDYDTATDGDRFADYLAARPLDVLKIVPSHFSALLDSLKGRRAFPRRFLFLGGEALSTELARRVFEAAGDCRVVNHYGPTETTVGSLYNPLDPARQSFEPATTVPIGRPVSNTEVFILNPRLKPVPAGGVGELFIGGAGLARGYIHQPEQTEARFVPHPFAHDSRARLYRTGDLARLLPSGEVEFLGRADQQVKLRGFRIELGEIEARLREHAALREAVVLAREDEPGQQRLVAYCVPAAGRAPGKSDLRDFLRGNLPDYMIPATFITLSSLPLTPNGKVDRRALPAPDRAQAESGETYVAPRNAVETTLAEIWKEVLGVERVGVDDNFFSLGGDSILSIQIIARARRANLSLSPKHIFDRPTVAALAQVAQPVAAPVRQDEVRGEVALTPIQRWFFARRLPRPHHYNQSLLFALRRPLDPAHLSAAAAALVSHHDALRLRFEHGAAGWRQSHAPAEGAADSLRLHDLSALPAAEQSKEVERLCAEAQRGFDLAAGSLFVVAFFDCGAEPARVLLLAHHLVVDGVSWRVLLEDLQSAYEQAAGGDEISLPAKTTSFKEWAGRLEEYAKDEGLKAEAGYWRAQARRSDESLPVDYQNGQNTLTSARTLTARLTGEETRALLQEVPAAYRTQVNDALLAGLAEGFRRWSGATELAVELEGHGREDVFEGTDVTRTVGWFTSHYPVRLNAGEDVGATLRGVKEALRGVPGRGIGYGVLRYLNEEYGESIEAGAQVAFNYLGQFDRVLPESSPFVPAGESAGETSSTEGNLSHLLRVNAGVSEGQLEIHWTYSENVFRRSTVEALADSYAGALRDIIAHCRAQEATRYTPSDFPVSGLGQRELDLVVEAFGREEVEAGAAVRDNLEDICALSPVQQGMLFQSLYDPAADVYFRQLSFAIRGELDDEAFENAWRQVFERHTALRTCFFGEGLDAPVQVVRRRVALPLARHDLRGLPAGEQEARLRALLEDEQRRGIPLSQAPLMRLMLVRLADDLHQYVWSYHHLMLDGWSRAQVQKEVLALYEARRDRRELRLEPCRPYRDYVAWLRRQDLAEAEAFWRRTLAGFKTPTPLGTERAGADGVERVGVVKLGLTEEATAELQAFARRRQLTLNTLVQGAWGLTLGRLSGERDVVFGVVVSGRPTELEGGESIVGLFINTLPVRVRLDGAEPVGAWLRGLQESQAEARRYEHSPLVEVQRWSEVPRGRKLFESTINFGNYWVDASLREEHEGVGVSDVRFVERMSDALVLGAEMGTALTLQLLYDRRRFDAEEATRLLGELRALLDELTAEGERSLGELLPGGGDEAVDEAAPGDHEDAGDAEAQFVF
jgi:amino acid adenylation domain-containing protein/non-ribosomal peptide synthase protein (TIGR01720 family)